MSASEIEKGETEDSMTEGTQVMDSALVSKATAEVTAEEQEVVELGDTVQIVGGTFHNLRGKVYYRDADLIHIMPDGVSHRIEKIPLVEGTPDPSLGITQINLLEKRKVPEFVRQYDFSPEQEVRTFQEDGQPGPTYTIRSVNVNEDTAIFVQGDDTLTLDFGFVGIPRDQAFVVVRTTTPPEHVAAVVAPPAEPEPQPDLINLGEIEIDVAPTLEVIPLVEQIYPDVIQRADMVRDLYNEKTEAQQKNPKTLVEIRKLTELYLLLRNDIREYRQGERPKLRPTSVETLVSLLEEAPLAKPVLDVVKTLYVDLIGDVPARHDDIAGVLLKEVVEGSIQFLKQEEPATDMPSWVAKWRTYMHTYLRPWFASSAEPKRSIPTDREFFRTQIPTLEKADFNIGGFPVLLTEKKKNVLVPLDDSYELHLDTVGKLGYSLGRALGPRRTRITTTARGNEVIDLADEAAIANYVFFPFDTRRDTGPIRYGNLLYDVLLSQEIPTLMKDILRNKGGVSEHPTADSIITIGVEGDTLGNIDVDAYLEHAPIVAISGFRDFEPLFRALGLSSHELNVAQFKVLSTYIENTFTLKRDILRTLREENAKQLTEQHEITQRPFTTNAEVLERLNAVFAAQPIITQAFERLKQLAPMYENIDIARIGFLLTLFPEFLDAVVGGRPGFIARERIRVVRTALQEQIREAFLQDAKTTIKGDEPVRNPCQHVQELVTIRKVEEFSQRMRLLMKFLERYRGDETETSFSCIMCSQTLLCKHEYLLLREFLHPREAATLHKELLLNYGDGIYHGKYICLACGQSIMEVEYDNNLEYDDEGRPMIGRSVLVDEEAEEDELFNKMLEGGDEGLLEEIVGDGTTTSKKFGDVIGKDANLLKILFLTAKNIFTRAGVRLSSESHKRVVQKTYTELLKLPDRAKYVATQKARTAAAASTTSAPVAKSVDYDTYIARWLIALVTNFCLIDIQTQIPDYTVLSALQGCQATFRGFPEKTKEENMGALTYMACVVASIQQAQFPWETTMWLRTTDDKRRTEVIRTFLKAVMDEVMKDATNQQYYTNKEKYLQDTLKKSSDGIITESLPVSFLPEPMVAAVGEEIVPAAAKGDSRVIGILRTLHAIAKKTAVPERVFTESSCCLTPIQTPGAIWKENGIEAFRPSVPTGSLGSRAVTHYLTRRLGGVFRLEVPENLYVRVFLKTCYDGVRIGYPHELGYTQRCQWCKFQFPVETFDDTAEKQALHTLLGEKEENRPAFQQKIQALKEVEAIHEQEVEVTKETFQTLLDRTHARYSVPMPPAKLPLTQEILFRTMRDMQPPPYTEWPIVMNDCFTEIGKLGVDANEMQQVGAWKPIFEPMKTHIQTIIGTLGKPALEVLEQLCKSSPTELRSHVITYFITPFQRAQTDPPRFVANLKSVYPDYELSPDHRAEITTYLTDHYRFHTKFGDIFTTNPSLAARATELIHRLSAIIEILSNLRLSLVQVGGAAVFQHLLRAMILGCFAEYIDMEHIPIATVSITGPDVTVSGTTQFRKVLMECIAQYNREAKKYSETEIRELLAKRVEREKMMFIQRLDKMPKGEKQLALWRKQHGVGEWAVGGTDAIWKYDWDRWSAEKLEREQMGFTDAPGGGVITMDVSGGFGAEAGDALPQDGYDMAVTGEQEGEDN